MQVMIQMTKLVFSGHLSKESANSFLLAARQNVVLLANIWGSLHGKSIDPTPIVQQIPSTWESVTHRLGLIPKLTSQLCCKKCFALYPNDTKETKCTELFFSKYRMFEKWNKSQQVVPQCDQALLRTNSRGAPKPFRTFNYLTLKSWLKD